jgi:hypothetical protein
VEAWQQRQQRPERLVCRYQYRQATLAMDRHRPLHTCLLLRSLALLSPLNLHSLHCHFPPAERALLATAGATYPCPFYGLQRPTLVRFPSAFPSVLYAVVCTHRLEPAQARNSLRLVMHRPCVVQSSLLAYIGRCPRVPSSHLIVCAHLDHCCLMNRIRGGCSISCECKSTIFSCLQARQETTPRVVSEWKCGARSTQTGRSRPLTRVV